MRHLLALLLAVWLAVPATAQKTAVAPEPLAPALWKLEDADTTVWLFGTVHALPKGIDWFRPHVSEAFRQADTLVLETLIPEDPLAMMGATIRLARARLPRPVAERVPPERRAELEAAVARLQPGDLAQFDTWYIALTLSNLESRALGVDPVAGAESVLATRARLRGMTVEGFETIDQQLGYFDILTEADQAQLLVATLDELGKGRGELDAMLADWLAGRTDALSTRINREFEGSPMLRQMLLDDRNARWAADIAERMKRPGKVFVAVGAGHLAGPKSLIEDLGAYGLTPERVLPEPPKKPARRRR
jgi:hypothetical protein